MLLNILVMSMLQILIGTLFISASSVPSQSLDCGAPVDSPESRGPAGKHPKQGGAWPWMAAIFNTKNGRGDDMELYCSGVLITRRHVLTTAHCVEFQSMKPAEYEVRVGNSDWRKADKYSVETIKLHEQYNARRFYDDLAILKLDRPAANVNVVCLPEGKMATGNLTGSLATVAGWTRERSGARVRTLLPTAEYEPIISNWECNRKFSKLSNFRRQFNLGISPAFLCAVANRKTCGALSGSPLMLKSDGKWQAVGILSFSDGCGASEYPEGFTRVSHYLNWIKRNTAS